MIDWQALATPTGRITKEHAYDARGMVLSNYVGVSDAAKHRIAEDHDLSDSWYFHDTALAAQMDKWDNRRKAHAA